MTQSTTALELGIIIGVDTHKQTHVAVAINSLGARLDACTIPTNVEGYQHLLEWATAMGPIQVFGIEGTGSYGYGLTRFLTCQGYSVLEVTRQHHARARHLDGKDDYLDAEHAARDVLAGTATVTPKATDGHVEMMRLIKSAKDTAVKAQTQVLVCLKATLVTADEALRERLEPLSTSALIETCAALEPLPVDTPSAAMHYTLASMAKRWLHLHQEIESHTEHIKQLTHQSAPELVKAMGIGPDTAAQMLITMGGNIHRVSSEAAFAKMCGVCPIPASSGKTQRHRLNRGGDRQANAALFRVVIVRMRWHEPTQAYVARRTAQGMSKREIIRCLKRYVAREIYHIIKRTFQTPKTTSVPVLEGM